MTRFIKQVANYYQVVAPTTCTDIYCAVFNRTPIGKIHAFACGNGWLYIAQNRDSFTYTDLLGFSNIGNAFDENINTYASKGIGGAMSETDALIVDYGSVADRLIYVKGSTGLNITLRFYYSPDGTNWTNILGIGSNSSGEKAYYANMRYIKATVEASQGGYAVNIHEIWAVSVANCYVIAPTWDSGIQKLSLGLSKYFVFARAGPSVTYAIYEENVPTSVQEVVIE